jgi:hypothetical protein
MMADDQPAIVFQPGATEAIAVAETYILAVIAAPNATAAQLAAAPYLGM